MLLDTLTDSVNHFCRGKNGMQIELEYGEFEDCK